MKPDTWMKLPEPILRVLINQAANNDSFDYDPYEGSREETTEQIIAYAGWGGGSLSPQNEEVLTELYETWTEEYFQIVVKNTISGFQFQIERLKAYLK